MQERDMAKRMSDAVSMLPAPALVIPKNRPVRRHTRSMASLQRGERFSSTHCMEQIRMDERAMPLRSRHTVERQTEE